MGDNELYSKITTLQKVINAKIFLNFLKWSYLVVFQNISLWRMGLMSYIVRIPLLQMNDNIFLHFL